MVLLHFRVLDHQMRKNTVIIFYSFLLVFKKKASFIGVVANIFRRRIKQRTITHIGPSFSDVQTMKCGFIFEMVTFFIWMLLLLLLLMFSYVFWYIFRPKFDAFTLSRNPSCFPLPLYRSASEKKERTHYDFFFSSSSSSSRHISESLSTQHYETEFVFSISRQRRGGRDEPLFFTGERDHCNSSWCWEWEKRKWVRERNDIFFFGFTHTQRE